MQTKSQIKKTWNDIAKKYGGYRRKTWKPIKDFLDNVDNDLLDIGCGNCDMTRTVLEKGVKLYGVDFSEEMLKNAPEQVIKIISNCTKIPLKRKFKYITAIAVMHHLPTEKDRINFLKEIKRLLAKEGQAIITAKYSKEKGDLILPWAKKHNRYYYIFSKKELKDLLEKVGFKNYKIQLDGKENKNYIINIIN
jgi:ubiquinone/menaquinone biosynthesis C-methylase UbiE